MPRRSSPSPENGTGVVGDEKKNRGLLGSKKQADKVTTVQAPRGWPESTKNGGEREEEEEPGGRGRTRGREKKFRAF